MTYFACFGYYGTIGLFLSCAVIAFCGAKALVVVRENDIKDPHSFNKTIGGKFGGKVLTVCCGLFSYSAYIIVLAGVKQLCGGSIVSVIIASFCAYFVLCRGFGTLVDICGVCAPVLAGIIAIIALVGAVFGDRHISSPEVDYMMPSAMMGMKILLYAGYNVLTSICVLGRCRELLSTRKNAILGGVLGGVMLFVSGGAVLLGMVYGKIPPGKYEMPVAELFADIQKFPGVYFMINAVIFTAMFLSVISGLTGTCVFFTEYIDEKKLGLILGLIAIPATYLSFGKLMDVLYPIFGLVGIFLIIVLALWGNKKV
jgi:uncharacterized membrane protein YkvI